MSRHSKDENELGSAHSASMVSNIVRNWSQNLTDQNLPGLLNELHGAIGRFEGGVFVSLYELLAAVTAVAQHLQADRKAWAKFCRHAFWDDIPKKGKPSRDESDALPYVMRFSMGSGDAARKSANRYVHAIRPLLEADVRPEDLVEEIQEAGGIMKLVAGIRAERRKQQQSVQKGVIKAADDKERDAGHAEKAKRKFGSGSAAELDRPDSTTGPVVKPAEEAEDDDGHNNDDVDLGVAIDQHLEESAASVMIELFLKRATRQDWCSTDPFPRKVHMVLEFTEAHDGMIEAELCDWRDDKPWPGANKA